MTKTKINIDSYIFISILFLIALIFTPIQFRADHKELKYGATPALASESAAVAAGQGQTLPDPADYARLCSHPDIFCWEEDIDGIIAYFADKYAVDAQILRDLAYCESTMNPNAVGDNGKSYGLYQIHLGYHPDITKEQATDLVWSTEWTARMISQGMGKRWTCWNKI